MPAGWVPDTAASQQLGLALPHQPKTHSRYGAVTEKEALLPAADLIQDNPFDGLATGCDWARNSAGRHIDFASFHLWPDNWLKVPFCLLAGSGMLHHGHLSTQSFAERDSVFPGMAAFGQLWRQHQ